MVSILTVGGLKGGQLIFWLKNTTIDKPSVNPQSPVDRFIERVCNKNPQSPRQGSKPPEVGMGYLEVSL